VTTGTVSALSGVGNDTAKLQIAAPVQQGVVQSKLNALRIAGVTGDIPQNVNFAVNGATCRAFSKRTAWAFGPHRPGAPRPPPRTWASRARATPSRSSAPAERAGCVPDYGIIFRGLT